jgi:flagellar hook-associated protein 3
MRVTQNMMINNMIYWTSKQTEKLSKVQTEVASGKQINKPSDDPAAIKQVLVDRSTISAYEQYESNISQALTWIEVSETTLDAVDTLLEEAQDIVVNLATGDLDSRETALMQLESIYEQVIGYANTKFSSTFLYSGNQSGTVSFSDEVSISAGTADDIVFELAGDASDVSIEIIDSAGEIVRTIMVSGGSVEGTNTISWDGCDDDGNPLSDGDYDFSVTASDSSGEAVAAYTSYRGDNGGKLVIIGEGRTITLNNDGGSIFSNILKVLSQAVTALEASEYDTDFMSQLGTSLGEETDRIATERMALANIKSYLETNTDRLEKLALAVEERISDTEVGNTEAAAIKLQAQETAYEVTLEAASSVLKMPKLSDYI